MSDASNRVLIKCKNTNFSLEAEKTQALLIALDYVQKAADRLKEEIQEAKIKEQKLQQ